MTVVSRTLENLAGGESYKHPWVFNTVLRRSGDNPTTTTVTPDPIRVYPVKVGDKSVISVDLDPGPCLVTYQGISVQIQVPTVGPADLQDLIDQGVTQGGIDLPSNAVAIRGYTPTWERTSETPPKWRLKVTETGEYISEEMDIWDIAGLITRITGELSTRTPVQVALAIQDQLPTAAHNYIHSLPFSFDSAGYPTIGGIRTAGPPLSFLPGGIWGNISGIPITDVRAKWGHLAPVGDGQPHYLGSIPGFNVQADFEAAFPRAFNVFTNWLKRINRTKPGAVEGGSHEYTYLDPHPTVSHWSNLTLDWAVIQEALEMGGVVLIPSGNYFTSDTLLARKHDTTVFAYGSMIYETRGGSRGNMLAIGEGRDISWYGGSFDATDALGDNCITIFQNQFTSAVEGWESTKAYRTIVRDVRCFNSWRHDIPEPTTYGGGKAVSIQHGAHAAIVSGVFSKNCAMGITAEGKTSDVPINPGVSTPEPYNAVGIVLSDCVVEDASMCGYYQHNSSNTTDPLANSVVASNMIFVNCGSNNPNLGVISLDRAANLKLSGMIVSSLEDKVTPVRGNPLGNVDIDVSINVNDVYCMVDTRNPLGEGNNLYGMTSSKISVTGEIRANTSTHLIYREPGSTPPPPQSNRFIFDIRGYAVGGVPQTAVQNFTLPLSNITKTCVMNPPIAPSTQWAWGQIEQPGGDIPIPYRGTQQYLDSVERAGTAGVLNSGSNINNQGKYNGKRVNVAGYGTATALGTTAGATWQMQVTALSRGTISCSTSSPTVTGSTSPTATRFNNEYYVGDRLYTVVNGLYTYIGTIQSIESATSLTLTSNAAENVTNAQYAWFNQALPFSTILTPGSGSALSQTNRSAVLTKSSNYSATIHDQTILVDASGGSVSVFLPAAASVAGKVYNVKKIDSSSNAVIVDGNGSETVDGANTKSTTTQWTNVQVVSNGSAWFSL